MIFEPRPENIFPEFIHCYFERCRAVCPPLRAIAGKWTFEDLIPGLSDFDTRLIFLDDVTPSNWIDLSVAVGEVHTELASQRPEWARILEHLPGLNLTQSEMIDPVTYYPEFQQWSFYIGDTGFLSPIRDALADRPWGDRDEIFHLKKFSTYYGPYRRGIDPAVNLGKWENKYPLHSRYMHYFTPPVQSAVSLICRRGIAGKFEALRQARVLCPSPGVIDRLMNAVERHYECPGDYREPALSELEANLYAYLRDVAACMADHVTLVDFSPDETPEGLRAGLSGLPVNPVQQFFEGSKFSRFMKGRLLFYGSDIAWFDTTWLIRNELGRIVDNFYVKPLTTYGRQRYGIALPPEEVLRRLRGDMLDGELCDGAARFAQTASREIAEGREKQAALAVAAVFEPIQIVLETLGADLRR